MELKQVQRKMKEKKEVRLNLLTTKSASKWMKDNSVSPQKIFDLAIKELMEKNK